VVAYNIYRRPDYSSAFVKIASRVAGPPYEDRLVMNGRTYIYAVTAIDQAGRESPYSAEVRATIP
jgi:fibronectin type 3 domain-containing protein